MYDYIPLFIPSNLGEVDLHICISPGRPDHVTNPCILRTQSKRVGKEYHFDWYFCFVWVNDVRTAQRESIRLSRELESTPFHPIQSNRVYLLPLFSKVGYSLVVNQRKPKAHPIIRVSHHPEDKKRPWECEIYATNLAQLQEALFVHERNLLKKRLQVLGK